MACVRGSARAAIAAAEKLRGAPAGWRQMAELVDGTREATFRSALYLQMQSKALLGDVPAVMMVNKLDLADRWEVTPLMVNECRKTNPVFETSALTGDGVEAAFAALAEALPP